MMPQNTPISDLLLEQYALGELSPEQRGRVRHELERDPALRIRLTALSDSDRSILHDYPPVRIVPAIEERARAIPRRARAIHDRAGLPRWTLRALWALPVAAALVLAFSFGVFRPETRMKGISPHLTVFVQAASGAVELAPGAAARQGQRIQLSYTAAGAKYAAILSIDGRGTVTWHLPQGGGGMSPAVEPQGRTVLPRSYELDDAPRFERFFFVYDASAFNLADVQTAALSLAARGNADTAALALPRGVDQVSFLLRKG
jgi:anti-sigma-K factor RskA